MKKTHHKITSKIPIWTPKIKSNTTLCQIDYFSQKNLKFQMTNSGQNEKINVSKAFIFRIDNMFYLRAASKSIRRLKILWELARPTFWVPQRCQIAHYQKINFAAFQISLNRYFFILIVVIFMD